MHLAEACAGRARLDRSRRVSTDGGRRFFLLVPPKGQGMAKALVNRTFFLLQDVTVAQVVDEPKAKRNAAGKVIKDSAGNEVIDGDKRTRYVELLWMGGGVRLYVDGDAYEKLYAEQGKNVSLQVPASFEKVFQKKADGNVETFDAARLFYVRGEEIAVYPQQSGRKQAA